MLAIVLALCNRKFVYQDWVANVATGDRKAPNVVAMLHLFENIPRRALGDS